MANLKSLPGGWDEEVVARNGGGITLPPLSDGFAQRVDRFL